MMMDVIDIIMMVLMLLYLSCSIQPMYGFSTSTSTSTSTSVVEEDVVQKQLGYLPNNFVRVAAWNKLNEPVAIQTYPLNGGAKRRQAKSKLVVQQQQQQQQESSSSSSAAASTAVALPLQQKSVVQSPFPTLFWLTCPHISKAIADLEGRGYVKIFENELNLNPSLVNQLLCCHEEYALLRWQSLTEEDRNILMTTTTTSSSSSSSESRLSTSSLTPSLQRMRNIMELSGISGTNFTDWRYRDNDQHHHNDVTSLQNNSDNDNDSGDNNQQKKSKKSSDTNDIHALKVPPIKCLHAHYAHYRSTIDIIAMDDNSELNSDSTTATATATTATATTIVRTINPVGEMIHKQLEKDFPDLGL
jgi:hypothetical protein